MEPSKILLIQHHCQILSIQRSLAYVCLKGKVKQVKRFWVEKDWGLRTQFYPIMQPNVTVVESDSQQELSQKKKI